MLKELRLRFQHPGCWLQEATQRHPGLALVASGIHADRGEVRLRVSAHGADPSLLSTLAREWAADDRVLDVRMATDGPRGACLHVTCSAAPDGDPHAAHAAVAAGPLHVANGVEQHHALGESADVQDLLRALSERGTVEVLSIRDVRDAAPDAQPPAPTTGLTDRQVEALVLAHREGYYQWPRSASASELADRLGLSSSAFLDHLRHAEAKVVGSVMADLLLREPGRIEAIRARREAKTALAATAAK